MVKPSLPHHGPSVLERWHRSFHPPNPWYKVYRQARLRSCSPFNSHSRIFPQSDFPERSRFPSTLQAALSFRLPVLPAA